MNRSSQEAGSLVNQTTYLGMVLIDYGLAISTPQKELGSIAWFILQNLYIADWRRVIQRRLDSNSHLKFIKQSDNY